MGFGFWNFGEGGVFSRCEKVGLNMPIMYPTLQMTKKAANGEFSTRLGDGLGLAEKVGLNMLGAPKTRKGLLKHAWRSQNLKRLA